MKEMKKLLVILFAMISVAVMAQDPKLPVDSKTKKIAYKGVTRAKNWGTAKKIKDKDVRKDAGVYSATGSFPVEYPGNVKNTTAKGTVTYTVTITAADGKYSYVVTDLVHKGADAKSDGGPLEAAKPKAGIYVIPGTSWGVIKKETDTQVKKLIEELKLAMEGKPAGK
jgi:hypothetical protein